MKTKFLYLAALALLVSFTACSKDEPFDTQSPDDQPLILKPYNESGTGSFSYNLASPQTPLLDSVIVTPSRYTKVSWYLNGALVCSETKINQCFPAGYYTLLIEAVTEQGKKTHRSGSVTVKPNAADPYSDEPEGGRHYAPAMTVSMDGANLGKVDKVILSDDPYGENEIYAVEPAYKADNKLTFALPATLDNGKYFVRLTDSDANVYGANSINIYNEAVVLAGYEEFIPGAEWTITGLNLANVAAVKVDDKEIKTLTATATDITFTAPEVEEGKYKLSITNKDGSAVSFVTADGLVTEVQTAVSSETVLWTGPVALDWNADLVNITAAQMADVPVGSTILVYYDVPEAEYHNMRITTPWWGDDLVAQFDVTDATPKPFTFTYDDRCKGIVEMVGSWSIVGFGETINKITYK